MNPAQERILGALQEVDRELKRRTRDDFDRVLEIEEGELLKPGSWEELSKGYSVGFLAQDWPPVPWHKRLWRRIFPSRIEIEAKAYGRDLKITAGGLAPVFDVPLRKQPLVHVFPLREPEPPPNRIIRDGPDWVLVALYAFVILASVFIGLMAATVG